MPDLDTSEFNEAKLKDVLKSDGVTLNAQLTNVESLLLILSLNRITRSRLLRTLPGFLPEVLVGQHRFHRL